MWRSVRARRTAVAVSVVVLGIMGHDRAAGQPAAPMEAQASNQFALDLYGRLRRGTGNLILSPLSISSALAMAQAGAAGQTAQEISAVLHIPLNASEAAAGYAELVTSLQRQKSAKVDLSIANAVWGEQHVQFKQPFVDLLEQRYGATATSLDLARDPEGARRQINDWVADHTAGRIKDVVGPGTINRETKLVLTNAIYFKGEWDQCFKKSQTRDALFTAADGSKVTVAMMNQTASFGYTRGYDYAVLELLYEGKGLAMDVFLPDLQNGLPAFESQLTEEGLRRDWMALEVQKVAVQLPRFSVTWGSDLRGDLAALGMRAAFDPSANFSSMSDLPLQISRLAHKALVEVNEQGTEAAAATSGTFLWSSAKPPRVFCADRPFLFIIRDLKRSTILFMGRLSQPSE